MKRKKHHIIKKNKILHNPNVKQRLLMNIKNIPQPDKTTSRDDNYEKLKQELEQDVTKI